MANIKQIRIDQLKVGMYITDREDEWITGNSLRAEGLITRPDTVQRFSKMGVSQVYIDADKGLDCSQGVPITALARRHQQELDRLQQETRQITPRMSFAEARPKAQRIRTKALSLVGDVMQDVKMGRKLDVGGVEDLAAEVVDSLTDNHNALTSMLRLRCKDQYLLEHSFSVAVLMGMLARSLGYGGDALQPLVVGALLHDVGKIQVPEAILNKPGRLDEDEWREMQCHVKYGMQALAELDGVSDTAKLICAQHHERLDGSGYPFRLPAEEISIYGRMGAVVDVYDAITADRVYHRGMLPTIALRKMLEWSGNHLDRDLVYQLIRCISVYPPGAMVMLRSGHLALVQEVNALQQNLPVVEVIFDSKRRSRVRRHVVNLAEDSSYGEVLKGVEPADYGINLADYL